MLRVQAVTGFVLGFHTVNPGEEVAFPDGDPTALALLKSGAVERVGTVVEAAVLNRGEKAVRVARPIR